MENPNETANTPVEELPQEQPALTPDATGSSPVEPKDQEIDFSTMSREELEAFARTEHQTKVEKVGQMRQQARKHRPSLEELETTEVTPPVEETVVEPEVEEDELQSRIDQAVERKLKDVNKEKTIKDFAKGSTDWFEQQPWATPFLPETPGSDPLYLAFVKETKRLAKERNVDSAEAYQYCMKLAAVNVTGKADALQDAAPIPSPTIAHQRAMSTSPSGAAGQPTKPKISARAAELAKNFGHDPEAMYSPKQ